MSAYSAIKEYAALAALFSLVLGAFLLFDRRKVLLTWWIAWMLVLTGMYLTFNAVLFFSLLAIGLLFSAFRLKEKSVPLFLALLPAFPPIYYLELPGLVPGIRFWFDITFPRVLTFCLLIPLLIIGRRRNRLVHSTDLIFVLFLLLMFGLSYTDESATGWLREGFYIFIDFFVIYYVVSRFVATREEMNRALLAIAFSGLMLASVGVFEQIKGWRLYEAVQYSLDLESTSWFTAYYYRGDLLRVNASFKNTLSFGIFLVLATGIWLYVQRYLVKSSLYFYSALFILLLALFFTVSRGPWLGFGILVVLYAALSSRRAVFLATLTLMAGLVLGGPLLVKLPLFDIFQDVAPYRTKLVIESASVISKNPVFGTADFREYPEMQTLVQGQGIIDIVNTYVYLALRFGLVGLALFIAFNLVVIFGTLKAVPSQSKDREMRRIGLGLVVLLVVLLFMIGGTSYINLIPYYHVLLVAMCVAYMGIRNRERQLAARASEK